MSVVAAGVPDVLADSTGSSDSARPFAMKKISAPPSIKKKKKGKKGKKIKYSLQQ